MSCTDQGASGPTRGGYILSVRARFLFRETHPLMLCWAATTICRDERLWRAVLVGATLLAKAICILSEEISKKQVSNTWWSSHNKGINPITYILLKTWRSEAQLWIILLDSVQSSVRYFLPRASSLGFLLGVWLTFWQLFQTARQFF